MPQLLEFIGNHPWLVGAFVLTLVLLIGTEISRRLRRYKEVSPAQATRLVNRENAVLLDVRSAGEFQSGHIAGARHVALENLEHSEKSLKRLRGKPVVAYCARGPRAIKAAAQLTRQGFEPVYVLAGGLQAWQGENLPVARGKA